MINKAILLTNAAALAALCQAANAEPVPDIAKIPIKHFVYIIQENISFDHYFGTYPGADGFQSMRNLHMRRRSPDRRPVSPKRHINTP